MPSQHSPCRQSQRVADLASNGIAPATTSLTEKEFSGGHLRVSMRPGRLVRQDSAARYGAAGSPLFEVREPSEASVLGADVQVRVTNCVDYRNGSRGQEPLRAGSRFLAAFNRRTQANHPADPHAAWPAKAMTPRPDIAVAIVRIDLQAVHFRTVKAKLGGRQRNSRKERLSVNQPVSPFRNVMQLTNERS